jgi:hypothetical protein
MAIDENMALWIRSIMNERILLNKKQVIHVFFCIAMHVQGLQSLM